MGCFFSFHQKNGAAICSCVSSNPVFVFFATPKSFGPLFLRLLLAAVFIYHGGQNAFGLFGGPGWDATVQAWSKPDGLHFPMWATAAVMFTELAAAIGLFFGILTRFFALCIMGIMACAIALVHASQGLSSCEYPFSLFVVALSLLFIGGGRWSIDRTISGQLLPTIG